MMKNTIIFSFLLFVFINAKAQKEHSIDTIYVRCDIEKLNTKYHFLAGDRESFFTNFSFNIKWELHGYRKENIEFIFNSLPMHYKPASNWFVKMVDTSTLKFLKKLYTLEQFTVALNKANFRSDVIGHKIQIIMLYGSNCSRKLEVYPVNVSTDLSNEG